MAPAAAPAALAGLVTADALATLTLLLFCFDGSVRAALLPAAPDARLKFAASLLDLLVACALRGALVLAPLLGARAALSRPGLAVGGIMSGLMTGWLGAKALLLCRLAQGGATLAVPGTGVVLHVATLVAAELLGIAMAWLLWGVVLCNRTTMAQPAAGSGVAALALVRGAEVQQQLRQRLATQQWLGGGGDNGGGGTEITAPLLPQPDAASSSGAPAGDASPAAACRQLEGDVEAG